MKLPHSKEKIAARQAEIARHKDELDSAQTILGTMLRENRDAEGAEEVRKARVVTPVMLKVLQRLEKGDWIEVRHPAWGHAPSRIVIVSKDSSETLAKNLYARLLLAKYIVFEDVRRYQITDDGRSVLKAAKKKP